MIVLGGTPGVCASLTKVSFGMLTRNSPFGHLADR